MKVLVSADHHIKLNTKNIPNDWAKARFHSLFDKLHELEKECDMHILAGDFFDKMPTLEELELYYEFVSGCQCETYIIPGNHEALKKDTSFLSYLKTITNRLNSKVRIVDDYENINGIDFIPYNCLKDFEKNQPEFHGNILVTHVRGEIPPHVKPEVNLDIFNRWDIVLAGDLHSYDNCQRNILYPGSPITTSFHRSRVTCGVILLDTDTLEHSFVDLGLPQLIRKTIKVGEPLIKDDYDHVVYEIEGDLTELAKIEDNELIDKKVSKRSSDPTLILSPEMNVQDEIKEYLAYVLDISPESINKIMKVYNDYSKDLDLG